MAAAHVDAAADMAELATLATTDAQESRLYWATIGDASHVERCLAEGASVEYTDEAFGDNALTKVAMHRRFEVLQLLLHNWADPWSRNQAGESPLSLALRDEPPEQRIVRALQAADVLLQSSRVVGEGSGDRDAIADL